MNVVYMPPLCTLIRLNWVIQTRGQYGEINLKYDPEK